VIAAAVAGPIIQKTFNDINNSLQSSSPSSTSVPVDTSVPSSGPAAGGLGDNLLKTDVWNSIVNFYASSQSCSDVTSKQIEITQKPDSKGVWVETWTVDACGQTSTLNVTFTPNPKGGTDYKITQ